MDLKLKREIEEIVVTLKKSKKAYLAKQIEENWQKTCEEYSHSLYVHTPALPLEKIMREALELELLRVGYNKSEIEAMLKEIEKRRILQTTPHISPAQKPRYFFVNWLASLSLTKNQYYPVAMFSGVPFSNKTRPGRLCSEFGDINLIPANMQDELVYRSAIPEKMLEVIKTLPEAIQKLLPEAKKEESYTKWAIRACQNIEKKYLHGQPVFFDFNEVVSHYLLLAIKDKNHPIYKILFGTDDRKKIVSLFSTEVFFYGTVKNGKYDSLEAFHLKDGYLESPTRQIKLTPENLIKEIKDNRLCPGLPLGFLAFTFLNDFKCFGSFAQTEYLPMYKKDFLQISCLEKYNIKNGATENITTTGGFPLDPTLHPLDLYLGKKMNVKKNMLFGETILAIKDVLLYQNYSTNMIKDIAEKKQKAHLIGICGKGMSALALMLQEKGWEVTGSDQDFYEPVVSLLKKHRIKILAPYLKENIPMETELIIIGRHAKLVPENNEEVQAAFASGKKILSLPEALGNLALKSENTIVAGSFGKSSTTALLAWCLINAKLDPSYFIGAVPFGFEKNAHLGKGKNFIFEGDEYPSSNWDKTPKFLYFRAKDVILISGEHDHLNIFKTQKEYLEPFEELVSLLPQDGLLVASLDGKNVKKIAQSAKSKIVFYSFNKKNVWHAENVKYGKETSFELWNKNKKVMNLQTRILGRHNIENIIGVCTYILEKKLLTPTILQKAVFSFQGVSGRLDLKTAKSEVLIYESFGSSYKKAKADFEAIKIHFPNKKIITIFEPHTFSWRNTGAKKWYKDIFATSDKVILLPPPTHGAKMHDQMSFEEIAQEVKKTKKFVYCAYTENETLKIVKKITKKNDIIILMSSGSLLGLTESVPKLMEKLFPK